MVSGPVTLMLSLWMFACLWIAFLVLRMLKLTLITEIYKTEDKVSYSPYFRQLEYKQVFVKA